jgi:hypothetical protein
MADTAKWVRVRLAAPKNPGPGGRALAEGELVLRADRVTAGAEHVVFHVGDEEVFCLDRRYYRTHAWFVDRPTFAEWLRSRRAQYPNQHRPWSEDEAWQLRKEITDNAAWEQVAKWHGRTVAAVRRKAVAVEKSLAELPSNREEV